MNIEKFYNAIDTIRLSVLANDTGLTRQALQKIRDRKSMPSYRTLMAFEPHYDNWEASAKYISK